MLTENNKLEKQIQECQKCKQNEKICEYIMEMKPRSFYGSPNPEVMIIGHSPAVRTSEPAEVVLKMNKPEQPLYKYITSEILSPLNISVENIYCTNMIKCNTSKLPENIKNEVNFFDIAFKNCRKLLEEEIRVINPKLIISLSERVLSMFSKEYTDREYTMKEAFGNLLFFTFENKKIPYIPVVHIPKGKNSLVARHYFPEQTERLRKVKDKLAF